MSSFTAQMNKIAAGYKKRAEEIVIFANGTLSENVIKRTPVDTGRARGSWQSSTNGPATSSPLRYDKTGNSTSSMAWSTSEKSAGKIYWLVSNVLYVRPLEYGYSQQAPHGMLRISIADIKNIVNSYIRQISNERIL